MSTTTPVIVALDGVACTTKTTMLKKMAHKMIVHFDDYHEKSVAFNWERTNGTGFIYTAVRFASLQKELDMGDVHLFDRNPLSSLWYAHVFAPEFDEKTLVDECTNFKRTKLHEIWKNTIILLVKDGQEDMVVEKMKVRGNGIDVLTREYVIRQNIVFRVVAREFNYTTFVIDYTAPLTDQQENVIAFINSIL